MHGACHEANLVGAAKDELEVTRGPCYRRFWMVVSIAICERLIGLYAVGMIYVVRDALLGSTEIKYQESAETG